MCVGLLLQSRLQQREFIQNCSWRHLAVAASVTPGGVLTAIAAAPAIRNWVNDEKSAEEDEYERSGLLLRRPMQGPRVIERIDLSS